MTDAVDQTQRRYRILIVGGIDGHLRKETYIHLMSQGHEVAVAAPRGLKDISDIGCKLFNYHLVRGVSIKNDLLAIADLRRIAVTWRPDIVHAFDTKPNYLVPIALSRFSKISVVRTINGIGRIFSSDNYKNYFLRLIFYILHQLAKPSVTHTIFQNQADRDLFLRLRLVMLDKTSLIPGSGIHTEQLRSHITNSNREVFRRELGWSGRVVYILVARLLKEKGVPEFISAARKLRTLKPDALCVLVGPAGGNEFGAVPLEVLRASEMDVMYLGERNDVPALLNAADIFVLPTRYREGIPRALLEAMAMGLPAIVTDMPGCGDVVDHAGCGLVIPAGDDDALANAMNQICTKDLHSLGQAGAACIDKYYVHSSIMAAVDFVYDKSYSEKNFVK